LLRRALLGKRVMSLMLLPGTTTGKQADARLGDC